MEMDGHYSEARNYAWSESEENNAAVVLFPFMDQGLKNSFYTCYRNYGKVSTKKLISCFRDPVTTRAVSMVMGAMENYYEVPKPPTKFYTCTNTTKQQQEVGEGRTMKLSWLGDMPIGPGLSPCVNNTCKRMFKSINCESNNSTIISSLDFFQEMCCTASEPCRIIRKEGIDVAKLVAEAAASEGDWEIIDQS